MSTPARRFGVQSYCFRHFTDNADVAKKVRSIGLDLLELCGTHANFNDIPSLKKVVSTYANEGVEIAALGVQTFDGADHEKEWFEAAAVAGAKSISAHFRPNTFMTAIPKVRAWCREFGIKVGIHCHGGYIFGGAPDVLRHLIGLGTPEIGLWMDTAWVMQIGPHAGDPVKWVDDFAGHLYGIHYKDFIFEKNGQWQDVIVGEGNLNLPAFLKALDRTGFAGTEIIEYEADVENPVPALTRCVEAMRKVVAA